LHFKTEHVVRLIESELPAGLRDALTEFDTSSTLQAVLDIKVVVKQLKAYANLDLQARASGALTQAAYLAMKRLALFTSSPESKVVESKKKTGHSYVINDAGSGRSYHLSTSSGKHLNAVLTFPQWVSDNARRLFDKRDVDLNQLEKRQFFQALQTAANSAESRLEMMQLAPLAIAKLTSDAFENADVQQLVADLIWIGVNKNQGVVKAIAVNFRSNTGGPSHR
jgi:hypothetical protein